ncbi:MAG: PAS domain-containing protein [Bacteroidota bacterium]|nr:PAS domain-containing protein [Bacteroidota bacterium]
MRVDLKTKLIVSLGFLFLVILLFGILGVFYINKLSTDAENIIKNNYETLVFSNNMLKAIDEIPDNKNAIETFESNLAKQEKNVTEPGEKPATEELRKNFEELKINPNDSSNYGEIRQTLQEINNINQKAIYKKNEIAKHTADDAIFWLTITFSFLTLVAFTLVLNIPRVIATPVRALSEGIEEIANKNYSKRIYLDQKDEFGDLANTFNIMAQKLDEYEHSNLAKIKFEKRRIETIINQMKDGIIGLDEKKNILFLNAVAEKLLGLKESEIIGQYTADIALKNDLMRTLLQNRNVNELKIYTDQKESYFNKDVLDVTNNNEVIGQVIVLRNITPFHELNEAKTNFIATVSHELKTPISSIKMSAQLLADSRISSLTSDQKELLKSITDDADRLLKITSELLNMSQAETGNIQLKLQAVQPKTIVEQALQAVLFQAQQKNIIIKKNIPQPLPSVQADAEKTSWVLINFLTNAIKYSTESSVIEVSVSQKENKISFAVADQGKGIEEKYLPKIFDRYFKVPGTYERSGTGLGLAISKEFIGAQGGSISVQSVLNEGSIFSFTLNAA